MKRCPKEIKEKIHQEYLSGVDKFELINKYNVQEITISNWIWYWKKEKEAGVTTTTNTPVTSSTKPISKQLFSLDDTIKNATVEAEYIDDSAIVSDDTTEIEDESARPLLNESSNASNNDSDNQPCIKIEEDTEVVSIKDMLPAMSYTDSKFLTLKLIRHTGDEHLTFGHEYEVELTKDEYVYLMTFRYDKTADIPMHYSANFGSIISINKTFKNIGVAG